MKVHYKLPGENKPICGVEVFVPKTTKNPNEITCYPCKMGYAKYLEDKNKKWRELPKIDEGFF